jgi:carbonic anhydrase/acetyltransferase-like protein (isoleucine patch superfamily)
LPLYALGNKKPRVHPSVMVAPTATIIGSVTIGRNSSVWPGAVLRGDYGWIRVGSNCSIQDNAVVHCSAESPGIIGDGVTVAHNAIIHACRIGDECLIGAGAIVFDGASVGKHSILGVGAVVPEKKKIPARSVAVGVPAKVIRRTMKKDVENIQQSYRAYVEMSRRYVKAGTFSKVGQ